MEAKFEKVVFNIVDGFLDKISSTCIQDKTKLWSIWKDMFAFPTIPVKPAKTVETTETKTAETTETKTTDTKKTADTTDTKKTVDTTDTKKTVETTDTKKTTRVKKMVAEEPKPVEVKPVEVKPLETKAEEPKPVEVKPVEVKTEEVKPVETKAEEPKVEVSGDTKKCQVVLSRGPRKGEVCGSSVSSKDPSSGKCTVHLK